MSVTAKIEPLSIPTYPLGAPEKNPLFFEKRVYQGSNGKVYPVPFIDKVYDEPVDSSYQSVSLENDYLRLVMLPEIGGRIFLGQDKVNDDYDFFYRQDVIKPALVGLTGPWISGGVEFNWPQHHRPGTYMPTDIHVEEEDNGAKTVWMSEHDPLNRLKGMHGIRVQPGSSLVELKARLYNRTPFTQTFLWWANVAAMVHDNYQSFFPADVHYVADHAVRAQSAFPVAENDYYGVDYASLPGANDLSWYKNIEVPTSYMVCDTDFHFFGGYDFDAEGGFIHVANRHIAPGKKQWTWGNHDFGFAWDRELTDENGPYVELMAGVYTDNQPDFTYLSPLETKTFSQYWWPYKKIGPVQNASKDAAVRLVKNDDGSLDLGAVVSRKFDAATVTLREGDTIILQETVDLSPDSPWQKQNFAFDGDFYQLQISVDELISFRPINVEELERERELATEPLMPEEIDSMDELYLTAEHLEQYRHPTRYPEMYWDEILRRDPLDSRTHIAYGRNKLSQGRLDDAGTHFEAAIQRLTSRHPNPETGEAHYFLGVVRRFKQQHQAAYEAFYKATWNNAWRAASYYELAMLDHKNGDLEQALEHCEASLDTNRQNNKAHILKSLLLEKLGRADEAQAELKALLKIDPLDHWARYATGDTETFLSQSRNDAQTILDIAYDYADAGFVDKSIELLELHHSSEVTNVSVPNPLEKSQLTHYALAYFSRNSDTLEQARSMGTDYFFPSRLHDQIMLEWAAAQPDPSGKSDTDRNAFYGLGNFYYDKKRHQEAIAVWEKALIADPSFATAARNLGIAYWNVDTDGARAREHYLLAIQHAPEDARIFSEYDQLRSKLGDHTSDRLESLLAKAALVDERDDSTVALCELFNRTAQPQKALDILLQRRFHPWEGGEGKVLKQYTDARLLLGQEALENNDGELALKHFELALSPPENLGEAYHLLQAKADVNYWKGKALRSLDREQEAIACYEASASEAGDFASMEVVEHSPLSYYKGQSLRELGKEDEAKQLFQELLEFGQKKKAEVFKIDYFATSLPNLLVFEEDLQAVHEADAQALIDLAQKALS